MKKLMIVLFMLMSVSLMAQTYGTNGWRTDIKLIADKSFVLDSAGASKADSASFDTGKMAFDADSISFVVLVTGDSATKRTSPYINVGVVGKIEWLPPDIAKTVYGWAQYTAYVTKAANADTPVIYGPALTRLNSQLFGNSHWVVYNADATRKKIQVKIYIVKYWRIT